MSLVEARGLYIIRGLCGAGYSGDPGQPGGRFVAV